MSFLKILFVLFQQLDYLDSFCGPCGLEADSWPSGFPSSLCFRQKEQLDLQAEHFLLIRFHAFDKQPYSFTTSTIDSASFSAFSSDSAMDGLSFFYERQQEQVSIL